MYISTQLYGFGASGSGVPTPGTSSLLDLSSGYTQYGDFSTNESRVLDGDKTITNYANSPSQANAFTGVDLGEVIYIEKVVITVPSFGHAGSLTTHLNIQVRGSTSSEPGTYDAGTLIDQTGAFADSSSEVTIEFDPIQVRWVHCAYIQTAGSDDSFYTVEHEWYGWL